MRAFEYHHTVTFEETNVVGNVYYTNHLKWQGRCRELFLRQHVPEIEQALRADLTIVTLHCSCDYLQEFYAFDEVLIRMRLDDITQNQMTLSFEYFRLRDGQEERMARGQQKLATMRREGDQAVPIPIPEGLREALRAYE